MRFAAGTRDSITDRPYFVRSECGRYTVTIPIGEPMIYGAWHVIRDATGKRRDAVNLGDQFTSAALAKKACEDHANA